MQNEFQFEPQVEDFDATEETPPFDCGHFVAGHMLRATMGKAGKPLPLGLYLVQAPSDDWCPALKQAVLDVYLGGQRRGRKRRMIGSGLPQLLVFELLSTADRRQAEQLNADAQEALALGRTVIVIASNLATVPAALQQASDRIIKLPP